METKMFKSKETRMLTQLSTCAHQAVKKKNPYRIAPQNAVQHTSTALSLSSYRAWFSACSNVMTFCCSSLLCSFMVMSNWVTWPKKGREDKEQMKTKGAFHLSELTSRTSQAVNRMHHFEGMLLKSNHSENSTRQFEEIQVWSSKKKKKKKNPPPHPSIQTLKFSDL